MNKMSEPYCPFYHRDRDGKLYCEGGIVKFPDKIARREIIYAYCASSDNFQNCTLCQMLMNYYDREGDKNDEG